MGEFGEVDDKFSKEGNKLFNQAARNLKKAEKRSDDPAVKIEAAHQLGKLYELRGLMAESDRWLQRAANQNHPGALVILGDRNSDLDEKLNFYRLASSKDPKDAFGAQLKINQIKKDANKTQFSLAETLQGAQDSEGVRKCWRAVLANGTGDKELELDLKTAAGNLLREIQKEEIGRRENNVQDAIILIESDLDQDGCAKAFLDKVLKNKWLPRSEGLRWDVASMYLKLDKKEDAAKWIEYLTRTHTSVYENAIYQLDPVPFVLGRRPN